ncbi:hypothetical protein StoSoilA2_42240 [Arthrobacter sp. StoSoilA2]|nr:uncharacterized protein YjbJ (UPF0337 family) [Arthrobacter sp. 1088]BCW38168.1 hypothetical protein StoSoilA2_42240 [Arthrobacter sp. StoSoilA2]BCW50600.1 hypothetical protein StoSoilB13_29420 [Arthrobacter sp. StoSoilB13]
MPTSGNPAGYNHMATRGVKTMGLDDKIKNATEEATGKVKEKTGEATGDRDLQAEGMGDQASANVKQAGEKVKDAAKDAFGDK